MKLVSHVDWFTATFKMSIPDLDEAVYDPTIILNFVFELFRVYGLAEEGVKWSKSTPFYRWAVVDTATGLTAHIPDKPEIQAVMLQASGKVCRALPDVNGLIGSLLQDGWNFSRLDMALDVFESGWSIGHAYSAYQLYNQGNKQRKVTFIESRNGDTLYLGSRTSAKFYRVYNKGAEQRVDHDWIRIEAEYKQEAAIVAANALRETPLAWFGDVYRVFGQPEQGTMAHIWMEMGQPSESFPTTVPPTRDGRERWISGTVIPTLERMVREDVDLFLETVEAALRRGGLEGFRLMIVPIDDPLD